MSRSNGDARYALKQAKAAARRGDFSNAERWSKSADRFHTIAERLAAPDPFESGEHDEAETRAELMRRLTHFASAADDINRWNVEREIYEANLFAAIANNTEPPAPLRPFPGGPLTEEEYLASIARGQF